MCVCVLAVVKQFQEYTEPGSGEDGAPQRRAEDEESVLLPLGDGTLTHNLGIPVVVVCTKVETHRNTAGLQRRPHDDDDASSESAKNDVYMH